MKNLLFIYTLFLSFGCLAATVCPEPKDLSITRLTFQDISDFETTLNPLKTKPLFYGTAFFELENKVWSLDMGFFDENHPRLQAKRLLEKAQPPKLVRDDEEGTEQCVYLENLDKQIPEFIHVEPRPDMKPCPSLEKMKETPFSNLYEICDNKPGCGEYMTYAEIEDRGTNWLLFSFIYKNVETAVSDTELAKNKAYTPVIEETHCTYFQGLTKNGLRAIMAIAKPEYDGVDPSINELISKRILQLKSLKIIPQP